MRHIQGTTQKWYEVLDEVIKKYNEQHISSATKMTPNEGALESNRFKVKTNLELNRKTNSVQPKIQIGDQVRTLIKKKYEKGYRPNWSNNIYTVKEKVPIHQQMQYKLKDIGNTLPHYKPQFMRHELLLIKKANN